MKFNFSSKSTNTMLVSIAGVLVAMSGNTAFAAETETKAITKVIAKAPSDTGFEALDGDSDGKISLKEAIKDPALAENFNKTDVNKDGAITVEEYAMYSSAAKKARDIEVPAVH